MGVGGGGELQYQIFWLFNQQKIATFSKEKMWTFVQEAAGATQNPGTFLEASKSIKLIIKHKIYWWLDFWSHYLNAIYMYILYLESKVEVYIN